MLIAAGGTGGHIYPGIAVAKEILRRWPDSEVRFVGTARGLENKLVPQAGFELSIIESTGLKNVGPIARMRGLMIDPEKSLGGAEFAEGVSPRHCDWCGRLCFGAGIFDGGAAASCRRW